MSDITSYQDFKEYCLRRLGKPVIKINIDNEQVEDRINDAIRYWNDHHGEGTYHTYLKHQITAKNRQNEYITLPEDVIGVIGVFDIGDSYQTNNLFNLRYQIHLNDLFNITSTELTSFWLAKRHIEFIEEIFVGKNEIDFNRHRNKLYINGLDWENDVLENHYIIINCYKALNPEEDMDAWNDWWLKKYATALIKKQWGENLKKYQGVTLPGGIQLDGQTIWQEATEEIRELEEKIVTDYSLPVSDMMG